MKTIPMVAELKQNVLLQQGCRRYFESSRWDETRALLDASYPQQPCVVAGYYEVAEIGNGGREFALIDWNGRKFLVHQDHASIVAG